MSYKTKSMFSISAENVYSSTLDSYLHNNIFWHRLSSIINNGEISTSKRVRADHQLHRRGNEFEFLYCLNTNALLLGSEEIFA